MGDRYGNGRLTQREIIKLFKDKIYSADTEKGIIYGRNGKALKPQPNEKKTHWFVELYAGEKEKRKAIMIQRLIWMLHTNRPIPTEFEIHHRDRNTTNNCWENLICVHKLDHPKYHEDLEESKEVPF